MWKEPGSDEPGYVDGRFDVCGGLFADNGNDSFRGKVYNGIFKDATGISLYEDLTNQQCRDVIPKLQEYNLRRSVNNYYGVKDEEWSEFIRMWIAHSEAGHWLWAFY
jgi:hypothetical protein